MARSSLSWSTPAPTGPARGVAHGVIIALLLAAAGGPLRYYLGDDPYDERFAWRMFSGVRLQRCQIRVVETVAEPGGGLAERTVDPGETVHPTFENLLRRFRRPVVQAFLDARCTAGGRNAGAADGAVRVHEVRLDHRCRSAGGDRLPPTVVSRDCRRKETRWGR